MIFNKHRFLITSPHQHPMKHTLSDFAYSNNSLPSVTTVEEALNTFAAVLYPQCKPAVADLAALNALSGNVLLDYRIVLDNGDSKSAAYRYEKRDGDVSPQWYLVGDFDFGSDSLMQLWSNNTIDRYVMKWGYNELDNSGTEITGTLAGQKIYGGRTANTNLTLFANNGDFGGGNTGFVQFGDNSRPTGNNLFSFGTNAERWLKGWFTELQAGTLNLVAGQITDSSGAISFGANALSTSGSVTIGSFVINTVSNKLTNTTGTVDFDNEHILTTGNITSNKVTATGDASVFKTGTSIADFTFTNGNIASSSATVNFNALNLTTTGSGTFGSLYVDTFTIDSDNIFASGNIAIQPAVGFTLYLHRQVAVVSGNLSVLNGGNAYVSDGFLQVSGSGARIDCDNLRLDGNTISSTDANGFINLIPNGTGQIALGATFYPTTDSSFDLGKNAQVWNKLWIDGAIGGATEITISDLLTYRSGMFRDAGRTLPAQAGDTIFWNGTQWLASAPDTEIDHGAITGLSDDDHSQYALLFGRAGSQLLNGGVGSGEHLTLDSTSHATKGFIRVNSSVTPLSTATYSGSWSGIDLGGSSFYFKDIYTKGEHFGLRLENVSSNPSASGQNVGRLVYNTTDSNVYFDTGIAFIRANIKRFEVDTVWNGTDTTKTVTVSEVDATKALWQFSKNADDYETMYPAIKRLSATSVSINFGSAPSAGNYRLIGLE